MTDKQCYAQNKKTISWLNNYKLGSGNEENFNIAIEAIKRANEALLEKTTEATWIGSNGVKYRYPNSLTICSKCKEHPGTGEFPPYCPNCGSKMKIPK